MKHLCEFINASFAEKHTTLMCQTAALFFVYKHTLASGTEHFAMCQEINNV
jgi:hypothetical protein